MRTSGYWKALLAGSVALCLSCSDGSEHCPGRPPCGGTTIEGYLLGADGPLRGFAGVSAVGDASGQAFYANAPVDERGWYSLDAPAGRYLLWATPEGAHAMPWCYYTKAGPVLKRHDADTLEVVAGERTLRADFPLGALHVRVGIPHDLLLNRANLILAQPDSGSSAGWRDVSWTTLPDPEGGVSEVEFEGIPGGAYALRFESRGQYPIWLPSALDVEDADTVTVAALERAEYEATIAAAAARLSGEVVGSWQSMGLSRPDVRLVTTDSMIVADVRTDGQGEFAFTLLHEFVVRIQVSIAGYDRWIGGDSFEEAQEFNLRLGEEITDVRYVESGLLLERPLESLGAHDDLIVEVFDADTQRSIWPGGSSMGSSSHLHAIANLSPGNYWLQITPAWSLRCRWLAQWYDRADDSADATVITIQDEGETVPVTLSLTQGGGIAGTVSWTGSEESPFVSVCLTTASSAEHLGRLTLGSSGQEMSEEPYEMLGLADGGYRIGAWICPDYPYNCEPINVTWYPGTADWESAEVVEIRDLGDIEGIDLELP